MTLQTADAGSPAKIVSRLPITVTTSTARVADPLVVGM
jgi:hypothetical protein